MQLSAHGHTAADHQLRTPGHMPTTAKVGFRASGKVTGRRSRGQCGGEVVCFATPSGLGQIRAADRQHAPTVIAPARIGGIVAAALLPLSILDLVPSIPVATQLVQYTREQSTTNNAAFTADRGANGPIAAPVSSFAFVPASVEIRTTKHLTSCEASRGCFLTS